MTALARTTPFVLHDIHADVWHAHALSQAVLPVLATGDAALDAQLPGGGWPIGALTEVLQPPGVHSEWRLLLPALARSGLGPVVLVGAPHLPFAPALAAQGLAAQRLLWVKAVAPAARLWACEQALRCAEVSAVLAWLPQARSDQLRRLQMAAAEYGKLLFVMRPQAAQDEASPAALRLYLQPQSQTAHPSSPAVPAQAGADSLQVRLLKRRGPPLGQPLQLQARASRLTLLLASSQAHALDCRTSRA
ncbi:translesion DNA synthesis-associated protein ImuA [Rhodoferax lacus]|uniref:Translesion DNA synthesis-associated protein ImuA n=1 Tax=Rhodoferax lacus TaxID=2184758 RepID=A0A3E1RF92_9BURK|nr:translesion DNA synthesis-associated protein ImuA [Rhodoferax lacus]RFO97891.1 translesion DNA synthesis-associated protein ImuA [Rhodoferax lacus]